jgi:hypothetical protein
MSVRTMADVGDRAGVRALMAKKPPTLRRKGVSRARVSQVYDAALRTLQKIVQPKTNGGGGSPPRESDTRRPSTDPGDRS